MPRFQCRCGHLFRLGRIPVDGSFLLVPDSALATMEDVDTVEHLVANIDEVSRPVLVCPDCNRIWLEDPKEAVHYIEYVRAE